MNTDEKLDDLIKGLATLSAQWAEIFRLVKDHQLTIHGNGNDGLKTRLTLLEDREATRRRWEWIIRTAIVGAIVGLFFK